MILSVKGLGNFGSCFAGDGSGCRKLLGLSSGRHVSRIEPEEDAKISLHPSSMQNADFIERM